MKMKTKIRVKDDATEAVGCVPHGAPHIHAGTCGEIVANNPFLWPHPLAGRVVDVAYVDADAHMYVVHVDGGEYLVNPAAAEVLS